MGVEGGGKDEGLLCGPVVGLESTAQVVLIKDGIFGCRILEAGFALEYKASISPLSRTVLLLGCLLWRTVPCSRAGTMSTALP